MMDSSHPRPQYFNPDSHPSLTTEQAMLVLQVTNFTRRFFQNPKYDASHDFDHVKRVVYNAIKILDKEQELRAARSAPALDSLTVILAAILHDVDDKKYAEASSAGQGSQATQELIRMGVAAEYAAKVQTVVDGVSYSSEIKNPQRVQELIAEIPELAVVQDADRLDAIGAIGIGRCFTFGGAKGGRKLDDSIDHFDEKLLKLEDMMKTETGRELAAQRSNRVREFMNWWQQETKFSGPS